MKTILIFILVVVVVGGVGVWWRGKYKEAEREVERMRKEIEKEKEILGGFEEYNKKVAQLKEERKRKILDAIKGRGRARTKEVAEIFEVSRTTAFRYLEELEKDGKIEQVGAFGKEVEYKVKV